MRSLSAAVVLLLCVLVVSTSNPAAQSAEAAIAFGNHHAVALRTNGDVGTKTKQSFDFAALAAMLH